MKSEICVFLAILASFACAFTVPKGEGIYELTSSTLNMATEGDWLLILYASWCPHCHSLLDQLPELASEIKGEVKIGIIDADAEPAVQMQFSMHGFPSLYMVHNGEVYAYPDNIGRSVDTLAKWVTKDYANEAPVTGYKAPFGFAMRAFALYSAFAIGTYRFLEVYAEKLNVPPMWFFCGVAVIFAVLVIVIMIIVSRCRRPAKPVSQRKNADSKNPKKKDAALAAPIVQRVRAENPIEGAAVAETEKVKEQVEKAKEQQELRRRATKDEQQGTREQQKKTQKKQNKQVKAVRQQNRPTQQPSKH